jgi:hypothetical protein
MIKTCTERSEGTTQLDGGNRESGRLSRACLGLTNDIVAFQQNRDSG